MSLEIANLKLDARRNCYPNKDYLIIENVDGTPISAPICTLIRRNPIRAMAQNALCVKLGLSIFFNFYPFRNRLFFVYCRLKYLQLALTWLVICLSRKRSERNVKITLLRLPLFRPQSTLTTLNHRKM